MHACISLSPISFSIPKTTRNWLILSEWVAYSWSTWDKKLGSAWYHPCIRTYEREREKKDASCVVASCCCYLANCLPDFLLHLNCAKKAEEMDATSQNLVREVKISSQFTNLQGTIRASFELYAAVDCRFCIIHSKIANDNEIDNSCQITTTTATATATATAAAAATKSNGQKSVEKDVSYGIRSKGLRREISRWCLYEY